LMLFEVPVYISHMYPIQVAAQFVLATTDLLVPVFV